MKELVFEVTQEIDGGFSAEALGYDIFTQAETWDALRDNIKEAATAYFYDASDNVMIRLHLSRNEVFSMA